MKQFSNVSIFRLLLLFFLLFRLLTFFLTKPVLKEGDLVQISGIISEISKIGFKTIEIKVNGEYVVEIPVVGAQHVVPLQKNERITVVGKVECQIFPSSVGAQHVVPLQTEKNCRQIILAENHQIFFGGFQTQILNFFDKMREWVRSHYLAVLPQEEAEILTGVMLGSTKGVSKEIYDAFIKTGTIHLFAASGMNLVIFCGVILKTLNLFFNRKRAVLFSMIFAIFYVFLTGFSPSMTRAAFMFIFVHMALVLGRLTKPVYSLGAAAGFLLFLEPELILNLGFQLSVVSTLAIVLLPLFDCSTRPQTPERSDGGQVVPLLRSNGFRRFAESLWGAIRADFMISTACFLFTAPLIVFTFEQINLLSVFVNLSVLWLIEPIMIGGVIIFANSCFSFAVFPMINLFKKIILMFSNLDIGVINVDYRGGTLFLMMVCLAIWAIFITLSLRKREQ